jgi:predicted Zn-dependent protease
LNNIKESIQVAANAIKTIGSTYRTLALYGEALSKESSTQEKSKSYLYKSIRYNSNNQDAVTCLVRVCMNLMQFNEALDVLTKYVRLNNTNHKVMNMYSDLLKKCGRQDEIVIYMNKVSGMNPLNAQIKSMLERSEQDIEEMNHQDETYESLNIL